MEAPAAAATDGAGSTELPKLDFSAASAATTGAMLLISLGWISVLFNLLRRKVDTAHPVYALVLQDVSVMLATNLAAVAALPAFLALGLLNLWMEASLWAMIGAAHFHQVTWLVLTALRMHIILCADPTADLQKLFRPCQASVWTLFVVLSAVFHFAREAVLGAYGVDSSTFYMRTTDVLDRWQIFVLSVVITNIPDMVSVVLYLVIYARADRPEDDDGDGDLYGGIYVGEVEQQPQLPGMVEDDLEAIHHPAGIVPLPPAAPAAPAAPASSDEAQCALRALRVHSCICLLDVAVMPLFQLLPINELTVVLAYHVVVFVVAYCLSVVSSVLNFGKLRQVAREAVEAMFEWGG